MTTATPPAAHLARSSGSAVPQLDGYFQHAHAAFQVAEEAQEQPTSAFYSIGGYTIQLRSAGPAVLERWSAALEHVKARPQEPALTVLMWDSVSAGTTMASPPWDPDEYDLRGQVRSPDGEHPLRVAYHLASGVLSMLDLRRNLALHWVRDTRQLPYYEVAAPLLRILHWWMAARGLQCMHVGGVGTANGGVMLAGKSGSGKSTTCLACVDSQLSFVGDDFCLLQMSPEPVLHSLYSAVTMAEESFRKLPPPTTLVHHPYLSGSEKALLLLHQRAPEKIITRTPVRALLIPCETDRSATRVTPVPPEEAFKAFAPSTLFQLPGADNAAMRTMGQLVRTVPSYRLELGKDLSRVADLILDLLYDLQQEA